MFDTENRMPADKICFALNQRLPEDIRVLQSDEVPLTWHPRKQNCVKTYEYRILNRKISMPTRRLYSHFCYFDMDEPITRYIRRRPIKQAVAIPSWVIFKNPILKLLNQ